MQNNGEQYFLTRNRKDRSMNSFSGQKVVSLFMNPRKFVVCSKSSLFMENRMKFEKQ